ncbi:MAG: site-2 protease family protein [Verrucomicrobiales bacterium]|nr:site-2 protease family protein [Verrucomicrobiales bacterium]
MLGPSLSLGRIAGIPVRIHWTFSLLILFAAFSNYAASESLKAAGVGTVFLILVFLCVVLHEFGHALTARRFGVNTRSITLSPIGGVASMDRIPEKWTHEFWITAAGPAVNVAICLILAPFLFFVNPAEFIAPFNQTTALGMVAKLFAANAILALFNLIPAFPMDGGRILRSVLSSVTGRLQATTIAARIGQGFALLLGLAAFFLSPFLLLIAGFVFLGAEGELRSVRFLEKIRGLRVSHFMRDQFVSVSPSAPIHSILDLFIRTGQKTIPVVEEGRLHGLIDEPDVRRIQPEQHQTAVDLLRRDFVTTTPETEVFEALSAAEKAKQSSLPVITDGRLIGLFHPESPMHWAHFVDRAPRKDGEPLPDPRTVPPPIPRRDAA